MFAVLHPRTFFNVQLPRSFYKEKLFDLTSRYLHDLPLRDYVSVQPAIKTLKIA